MPGLQWQPITGARGLEGEEQPRAQLQVPWRGADRLSEGNSKQEAAGQHPRSPVLAWYPGLLTITAAVRLIRNRKRASLRHGVGE